MEAPVTPSILISRNIPHHNFVVRVDGADTLFDTAEEATTYAVELAGSADQASRVVMCQHRGGSMWLHENLSRVWATALEMPCWDVGSFYGYEHALQPVLTLRPRGVWYSRVYGDLIGSLNWSEIRDPRTPTRLLAVIRDPHDVAVSLFYSDAYSHPVVPGLETEEARELRRLYWQREGIHRYLEERGIPRAGSEFAMLVAHAYALPSCEGVVGRGRTYESMVTDTKVWSEHVQYTLDVRHLALPLFDSETFRLKPGEGGPWAHKRAVTPAGALEVFTPKLYAQMSSICGRALAMMEYDVPARSRNRAAWGTGHQ